jgi:DAACS family dicarboxylate/amino acid:cation (Na+ or H+) symporter
MLVVPLVFAALALGVAGLGDLRSLGRIGLKTLAYTVVVSTIAVLLGLFLVNTVRPGTGVSPDVKRRLLEGAAERAAAITAAPAPKSGIDLLVQIVPDNPIRAAASGDMLAWMFFALMIGVGLCLVRTEAAIRFEERDLVAIHGAEYERYRARTPMMVPRLRPSSDVAADRRPASAPR